MNSSIEKTECREEGLKEQGGNGWAGTVECVGVIVGLYFYIIGLLCQNIMGFIKKQRLNWLGHVERMAEDNIVQKIKRWKPMYKRPIGRPKTRWEDDVLEDIKSINISNWKKVAQNRDSWKKVVEQAKTLYRL